MAAPVAAPPRASRHVALRRPCRMPRHPTLSRRPRVLHCDVHREGRVRRAPHSVPCPPPTVPSRFSLACQRSGWAALSRRASLKCVAHWSSFSPDFQLRVPVPLGDHGILSQRTQVCVVFRDSGVLASSTRALVVSAVPLDDLRHSFFFFKVPRRPLGRGDRQGPWECHMIILVPARWAELTAEPARSGGDASSGHGPGDEGRAAVAWRVCSSWNKTLFYHLQSPLLASPPARHLGACRLSGRLSRCSSSPTRDGHMSPSLAGSERARVLVPTALIAGRIGSITHRGPVSQRTWAWVSSREPLGADRRPPHSE